MTPRQSLLRALLSSLGGWCLLISTASAVLAGTEMGHRRGDSELLLEVTDADTGAPVPARVRLARAGSLAEPRMLLTRGHARTLRVEPGEYVIRASHGPEWSVAQAQAALRAGERQAMTLSLRREAQAGRYVACDLHVHTHASYDSQVRLDDRLLSARAEDLRVAVITDHNRSADADSLPQSTQTRLVRGIEITTWDPEFGHFNWFPSDRAPAYKHASPEQLLASLPAQAARFIQVNHPRLMRHIGYFELAADRGVPDSMRHGFDGIEVWNGYDLHRPAERDRVLSDWLGLVELGQRVVATGGSDSHDLERTIVGYPRTYVAMPEAVEFDDVQLAAALASGAAFVSNGPILELEVEGQSPGRRVARADAGAPLSVHVRVDAPAWMDLRTLELWLDGKRVYTREIEALTAREKRLARPRADVRVELPAGAAQSVLAMVRGERPMRELFDRRDVTPFAFTNPVWIDSAKPGFEGPAACEDPCLRQRAQQDLAGGVHRAPGACCRGDVMR